MSSKPPTQRTLEILRGHGYLATVTERWNEHAKCRQDLYGFVDVLALGHGRTVAIQATSAGHVGTRQRKLLGERRREVLAALRSDWIVEIWGLRKEPDRYGSTLLVRRLVLIGEADIRISEVSKATDWIFTRAKR